MILLDLGDDKFSFTKNGKTSVGNFKEMAFLAISSGVHLDEFDFAVEHLIRNGHRKAMFGSFNGTFLFTA